MHFSAVSQSCTMGVFLKTSGTFGIWYRLAYIDRGGVRMKIKQGKGRYIALALGHIAIDSFNKLCTGRTA